MLVMENRLARTASLSPAYAALSPNFRGNSSGDSSGDSTAAHEGRTHDAENQTTCDICHANIRADGGYCNYSFCGKLFCVDAQGVAVAHEEAAEDDESLASYGTASDGGADEAPDEAPDETPIVTLACGRVLKGDEIYGAQCVCPICCGEDDNW